MRTLPVAAAVVPYNRNSYEFQQHDAWMVLNLLSDFLSKPAWSIEKTHRGSFWCIPCVAGAARNSENGEKIPMPSSEDGLRGSFFSAVQNYSLRIL